jgi:tetratricopeptide (TPR) repeat protein
LKLFIHCSHALIISLLAIPFSSVSGQNTNEPKPLTTQTVSREKREQAYVKLLEGQRHMAGGSPSDSSLQLAQQSFRDAAELDPTLAEARNALSEIAFYYRNNLEEAESEARASVRIDRNNFGGHRMLARIYTLNSGLRENNIDKANAEKAIAELREVVRLEPADGEGWALLGDLNMALGKTQDAIIAYRNWASAPTALDSRFYQLVTQGRELTSETAILKLGQALLRAGRATEAFAAIRTVLSSDPDNEEYLQLLSEAIEAGGADDSSASSELQKMIAADPENTTARRVLARVEARAGRFDDAASILRAGIARSKPNSQSQRILRIDLAQVLSDSMRYSEAITVYEDLLKERELGDGPVSSEEDRRFATVILERITSLYKLQGRMSEALYTVDRMRRALGKSDPIADTQYILLLRDQGKRHEALQSARESRLKYPEQSSFLWLEASLLTDLGRVDEAVTLLSGRLKGNLEDFDEYLRISSIYNQAGRGKEAVEAARKALNLVPANRDDLSVQALIVLSSAQDKASDFKGSEESLKSVLSKDPKNATALNNLGYFLVERNERLPEALDMIKRAVKAEPTNASFLDSLGWAYFKLKNYEEAEKYLVEAARRDPTSSTVQEHLGDLYQKRGKISLARQSWQKALSLSVEAAEISRLKAKLNN